MRRSGTTVISLNRIFAVLLAVLLILGVGIYGSYRTQASHALREAKNVALSLKLLEIYSGAENYSVCDPSRPSGMSEAAEAELMDLARASGSIVLKQWDAENGCPAVFTYSYKQCIVTYEAAGPQDVTWSVDYRLPILNYG